MSVNTELDGDGSSDSQLPFRLMAGEKQVYRTTSSRQSLTIENQGRSSISRTIKAQDGSLYLTNYRLIFITATTGDMTNFCIELEKVHKLRFSHELKSPWLGANYWQFVICSGESGDSNMVPKNEWFKGTIKFNDGGVFSFFENFTMVLNDILNNKHIDEELPRYTA